MQSDTGAVNFEIVKADSPVLAETRDGDWVALTHEFWIKIDSPLLRCPAPSHWVYEYSIDEMEFSSDVRNFLDGRSLYDISYCGDSLILSMGEEDAVLFKLFFA